MGDFDHAPLPDTLYGYYDYRTDRIVLNDRLTERETRCTLAHERIHARDKDKPILDPWLNQKRERLVEREAACELITVEQMAEAIRWGDDPATLCDQLDVDLPMLQARIDALTQPEQEYLQQIVRSKIA
ncbi:MAG: ImmA/IrrE family metallo-endopeptidase [Candidatus Nanopelagicales bacterium]